VRRGTHSFLLAGCALVLLLSAPEALRAMAEGWRGPYVEAREREQRTAALSAWLQRPWIPDGQLLRLARWPRSG
jgi:hypothetical protein